MAIKSYKGEGVVLARRSYGEADRILVLFTKNHGRLSLMAKGIRKPKSRKRGSLEVFSQIKFQAARGKSLDIMTEVETINSYEELRKSLKKVSVAYFFVETVGKITREEESSYQLYSLLVEYLVKLANASRLRPLRNDFTKKALVITGFWPQSKPMLNPDMTLESVVEREITSIRVGKKIAI